MHAYPFYSKTCSKCNSKEQKEGKIFLWLRNDKQRCHDQKVQGCILYKPVFVGCKQNTNSTAYMKQQYDKKCICVAA